MKYIDAFLATVIVTLFVVFGFIFAGEVGIGNCSPETFGVECESAVLGIPIEFATVVGFFLILTPLFLVPTGIFLYTLVHFIGGIWRRGLRGYFRAYGWVAYVYAAGFAAGVCVLIILGRQTIAVLNVVKQY